MIQLREWRFLQMLQRICWVLSYFRQKDTVGNQQHTLLDPWLRFKSDMHKSRKGSRADLWAGNISLLCKWAFHFHSWDRSSSTSVNYQEKHEQNVPESTTEKEVQYHLNMIVESLKMSDAKLKQISEQTAYLFDKELTRNCKLWANTCKMAGPGDPVQNTITSDQSWIV